MDRGQPRHQRVRRGDQDRTYRGGNGNLNRVLGIAAMAAVKKKDSYYGVYYRRLAARRGRQRALVAVLRKLASRSGTSCTTRSNTTIWEETTSPNAIPSRRSSG